MFEIRKILPGNRNDANLPNQPFKVWGRMLPSYSNGIWSYETELFPTESEMCFPDQPYDPSAPDCVFFGAYENGRCVGLAVLRREMFRYLCLDDLKVDRAYRGMGAGGMLADACLEEARAQGMQGVYAVAQDNNLSACLFYLRHGFELGGFDNRAYRGTAQEHKADLYFYLDC